MSSPALSNGTPSEGIARAARLSRYARHLLSANPALAAEAAADSPFAPDEMRTRLSGADFADEDALKTGLRRLRQGGHVAYHHARPGRTRRSGRGGRDRHGAGGRNPAHGARTPRAMAGTRLRPSARCRIGRATAIARHRRWASSAAANSMCPRTSISCSPIPKTGETDGPRRITNHEFFIAPGAQDSSPRSPKSPRTASCSGWTRACRPYGDSGPLAVSFDMLEEYFTTQGREWERYAWVKARTGQRRCAGRNSRPS